MPAPLRTNPGSPDDRQTITCLYCGRPQEVARRAMTITCKFCHKSLKLEDITVKQYESRKQLATCGIITVEKKGSANITEMIKCGGLIVRGKVKGQVESHGPVLIGPEAQVLGDVTAPTLAVGAGAVLEGQYQIGPTSEAPARDASEPAPEPPAPSDNSPQSSPPAAPEPPKSAASKPPSPPKQSPPPPPAWGPGKLSPPFKR